MLQQLMTSIHALAVASQQERAVKLTNIFEEELRVKSAQRKQVVKFDVSISNQNLYVRTNLWLSADPNAVACSCWYS